MEKLQLPIIWEDEQMLVVNKPPFVVVNRAESIKGETVQDWAEDKLSINSMGLDLSNYENKVFVSRSGVAHRLDKETSGCLLIAKNPKALSSLLSQFKNRVIQKEYLALVHGHLYPREGTIRLPLSRSRFDREKWEVRYSGKMAETTWRVEEYFGKGVLGSEPSAGSEPAFSMVRLFPKTGRTHQIRVHLSHLGFPIFSDEKYLTRSKIEEDRGKLPYHFLHAQKLGFKDMTGVFRTVEASLSQQAALLLKWMRHE